MNSAAKTALVLKMITRDEFGRAEDGYIAETFDRVTVLESKLLDGKYPQHKCRTDAGDVFYANNNMVQIDA